MESSNEIVSRPLNRNIDYCQNSSDIPRCHACQYLMCPHCSFHLCSEHGQQHQEEIENETYHLHNRAKNLEKTLNESEPVQPIIDQVLNLLNEWKRKMHNSIDQYGEQVKIHIEEAQNRLNDQWNIAREEHLQILNNFVIKPIDQLLTVPKQIHRNEFNEIHTRLIDVQNEIRTLLTYEDLLRINFDSCSLDGDINISRRHFPLPTLIPSREYSNSHNNIPPLDGINLLYRFDSLSTDTSALGVSSYQLNNSTQTFVTWVKPSTILVFDSKQGLIKRVDVEPSFLSINDIIWSDYLNIFLIAGSALHTFNVINNEINEVFASQNPPIWSITTFKTSLFVCYFMGSSPFIEHRSLPSFRPIQTYSRAQLLPTHSPSIIEIGRCIRTNGHHIAMTVRNLTTYEWRVDIFHISMQRLFKGEIFGSASHPDYWCCLLTSYRSTLWLIMNNTSKQETLTLIDEQARIRQQIKHEGYNICVLQGEEQIIIKDQQGLAIFHI